jgi:hypothetical protein
VSTRPRIAGGREFAPCSDSPISGDLGAETGRGRSKGKVNIAIRATDIDRKDITMKESGSDDYFRAFVASKYNQTLMKKMRLQDYLNEWGEDLPTYGSVVTKVVENGDRPSHVTRLCVSRFARLQGLELLLASCFEQLLKADDVHTNPAVSVQPCLTMTSLFGGDSARLRLYKRPDILRSVISLDL